MAYHGFRGWFISVCSFCWKWFRNMHDRLPSTVDKIRACCPWVEQFDNVNSIHMYDLMVIV